jgi:hypothetical protein
MKYILLHEVIRLPEKNAERYTIQHWTDNFEFLFKMHAHEMRLYTIDQRLPRTTGSYKNNLRQTLFTYFK